MPNDNKATNLEMVKLEYMSDQPAVPLFKQCLITQNKREGHGKNQKRMDQ